MSPTSCIVLCSVLFLTVACGSVVGSDDRPALKLEVVEPVFGSPQIVVLKSMPPQFDLTLVREMPSAGWKLEVDAIDVDADAQRIVARVTEVAPQGMAAQVLTPTWLRLSLGALKPADYVLEIRIRRGTDGEYVLAQALALHAS